MLSGTCKRRRIEDHSMISINIYHIVIRITPVPSGNV